MERSTCIICKKKRFRCKMIKFGQHYSCVSCVNEPVPDPGDLVPGQNRPEAMTGGNDPGSSRRPQLIISSGQSQVKVLNLYAGVGGNRWFWPRGLQVTAVEINPLIAAEYKRNFPNDIIIIGDAHSYLLNNYERFNIICASRPCQTHTRMNYLIPKKRYADMGLYQEILFLSSFFKGKYYCENVDPYYEPLIAPQFKIGRHLFWTNVPVLNPCDVPDFPIEYQGRFKGINVMTRQAICDWLGINAGDKKIYLSGKCDVQVYRNCIHPLLGQSIMNDILNSMRG